MKLNEFNVLLIDDDEDDYYILKDILSEITHSTYNLTWIPSFRDGIEALSTGRFDVCLLDYRLGELTGIDFLREVRLLKLPYPIIFLTGFGDFDLDIQVMQIGAADYLIKDQLSAPLLERSIRYTIKHALDIKELQERKDSFKTLFNSTFEGIIIHHKGTILDANEIVGDLFQIPSSEIIGQSLLSYIRPDYHDVLRTTLFAQDSGHVECVGVKADESEIYIELSTRTVILSGQPQSLVSMRDLTNRKNMEAQILQQDRLASLGLLASSLAHEIGNPLSVIRSRAEMAESKADEGSLLIKDLHIIISQIDRISKLVRSLLHLARGKQVDHVEPVKLDKVLDDVISLVRHELERKAIDLEMKVPAETMVSAESSQLGQVFLNLIINAVHAIEEARSSSSDYADQQGKISIHVNQKDHFTEISVQDSGHGISEKNMPHLFKPFFTTKDIGVGTGLGLATCYKLIQSWGGSIAVKSPKGNGAIFTVSLPK